MKPDGVSTTPTEPTEALGAAAEAEDVASVEQPQEDQDQSHPQPQAPENAQKAVDSTVPPCVKEANGKTSCPKNGTKAPVKTKLGTAAPKTLSATSRPASAQTRVANGVSRPITSAAKKPANAPTAAAVKKPTSVGASAQAKKAPTATNAAPRTQTKVAERKPVGTARPAVGSTSSGMKPVAATLAGSKKPVAATNNATTKPRTTAPRPATIPAARPAVSAACKVAPVPKIRPTTAAASHTSTSSARPTTTTTTTKPGASRTASVPSTARSTSLQPSKTTTTTAAAARKDAGQTSTKVLVRKPIATKTTNSAPAAAAKPLQSEPPKPATAAKRPPVDSKTTRPKADDNKPVPTRKVPPSHRNTSSKPTSASTNVKQAGSTTPVAVKRQTTKPTQSVSPMVIKGKPSETEQIKEPVEQSTPVATLSPTTDMSATASVSGVDANSVLQSEEPLNQEVSGPVKVQENEVAQVPSSEPSNVENVSALEQVNVESQLEAEAPVLQFASSSVPVENELQESSSDYISVETPAMQEVTQQESMLTPTLEVSVAATVIPKCVEVVEKAEQIIHNEAEEEEEEREGSQQVSISDMSGTQPTEESRPGSAGLAGSVWRAGGVLSELDSEDVSCSQQGASELSAPGVLEGTESMDDLGEASLKGADGEGASAGSPDFEKVPDIPANEDEDHEDDDEDDDDRVCDMEVGSERAEDSHRQCHDNEDEDEDVEMASEGITESGLESYGNADEDDFAEDYRLDNLNRMQPQAIVPSAPPAAQWDQTNYFADPWVPPQQDPSFPSSPSLSPKQANLETLAQASHQAWMDFEHAKGGPTSYVQPLIEPFPSSPQLAPVPSAEKDASFSPGLGSRTQAMSLNNTSSGLERDDHSCSDISTPEEQKDYNIISGVENLQQQVAVPANSVSAALPDLDLGIQLEHGGDEEEEPVTLPADDVLGGPATAPTSVPSSPSSATEDEASDTEGEMQISEPSMEPVNTGHDECFGSVQVAHSLSTLEEREEASVEAEGGGGSETPQSATSAASYGFDCTTTSNSNAQSTTESCTKSPGIFSLENEDQLPEEAKDPSLIKELILTQASAPGDADKLNVEQQEIVLPNSEQQYMHCVKVGENLPGSGSPSGTAPTEGGLVNPSQHQDGDWDLDDQHPYYSTICEKTDGSLAGMKVRSLSQPHDVLTIHMTMSPKRGPRLPVDHVCNPLRLPTDLPPRIRSMGPNAQLQRLERHQQQLRQIEQRHEQHNQWPESREEQREREQNRSNCKSDEEEKKAREQVQDELEEQKKREAKEKELEDQRRDLLQLQIQQQQEELKQRQQIMQWQQELEQQNKQQNKQSKTVTNVLLSPSGLCTIYETLETSDAEDNCEDKNKKIERKTEKITLCEESQQLCSKSERASIPTEDETASSQAQSTCSPELIQDQEVWLTDTAVPDSRPLSCSEQPSPLELDWGKKVDIVQQLINQTLLLAGDSCSPLYLLPGGSAGTLSPLETSLWPNLLPSLSQPSATVTSVSSFSPEASGSSPQGEWTVVELETHH